MKEKDPNGINAHESEATRTTSSPATGSTCEWIDQEDYWQTQCGDAFIFTVGGPLENNFKYCPYCGDKIILSNDKITSGENRKGA